MQKNKKDNVGIPKERVLKAQNDLISAEILQKESGPTDSKSLQRIGPKL